MGMGMGRHPQLHRRKGRLLTVNQPRMRPAGASFGRGASTTAHLHPVSAGRRGSRWSPCGHPGTCGFWEWGVGGGVGGEVEYLLWPCTGTEVGRRRGTTARHLLEPPHLEGHLVSGVGAN